MEPELSNFAILNKNIHAYPNVKTIHSAIWNHDKGVQIVETDFGNWGFQTEDQEKSEKLVTPSFTFAQLLQREKIDYVDLLKIDIEGAECELFSGETDWLKRVGIIVIELHDAARKGSSRLFYQAISQYDFKQSISGEKVVIKFDHARCDG